MRVIAVLLILFFSSNLYAQELCDVQDYDSEDEPDFECPGPMEMDLVPDLHPPASIPMEEGETVVAPWDGAFVHKDRLVQIGLHLKTLRHLRWMDRVRLRTGYELILEYNQDLSGINEEYVKEKAEIYREALDRANENTSVADKWYKKFWFGYVMGIVSAGLLVGLSAYAATAL